MTTKKNKYEKKALRKGLEGTPGQKLDAFKEKAGDSLKKVGYEALWGTLVGGAAGYLVGKPSLLLGAVVTGTGYYQNWPAVTSVGAGMMASGFYQVGEKLLGGTDENGQPVDGIKERAIAFKDSLISRLYLDKLLKSKKKKQVKTKAVNGLGEVQYLNPESDDQVGETEELDMSGLDAIEEQLSQSAEEFSQMSGGDSSEPEGSDAEALQDRIF